jgi:hypothetical protein
MVPHGAHTNHMMQDKWSFCSDPSINSFIPCLPDRFTEDAHTHTECSGLKKISGFRDVLCGVLSFRRKELSDFGFEKMKNCEVNWMDVELLITRIW